MTEQEIKTFLVNQICESMYMEEDELEDDMLFSDFGLESTTLIKIIAKVNEKYASSIEAKDLLAHQSLEMATEYIHNHLSKN